MSDKGYTLVELMLAITMIGAVVLCVFGVFVVAHFIGKWW